MGRRFLDPVLSRASHSRVPLAGDADQKTVLIVERHILTHLIDARAASAISELPGDEEWATRQAFASRWAVRALAAFVDEAGLPWRGRMRLERVAARLLKWEHERLLRRKSEALIRGGLSEPERDFAEDQVLRSRAVLKDLL